jgi:hypothetical protein
LSHKRTGMIRGLTSRAYSNKSCGNSATGNERLSFRRWPICSRVWRGLGEGVWMDGQVEMPEVRESGLKHKQAKLARRLHKTASRHRHTQSHTDEHVSRDLVILTYMHACFMCGKRKLNTFLGGASLQPPFPLPSSPRTSHTHPHTYTKHAQVEHHPNFRQPDAKVIVLVPAVAATASAHVDVHGSTLACNAGALELHGVCVCACMCLCKRSVLFWHLHARAPVACLPQAGRWTAQADPSSLLLPAASRTGIRTTTP